ncbi:MAG: undecaprenyl-diphosphate phosphatase [Chloroflexota bacterium]
MDFLFALILGIVEGLTEFLPISSTGHLLVASALLHFPPLVPPGLRITFDIFIQLGAVLAVIVYYGRDLLAQASRIPSDQSTQRFWLNILIAFLPAAIVGLLAKKWIDALTSGNGSLASLIIGVALVLGGIVFLIIERRPQPANSAPTHPVGQIPQVTTRQAFLIGLAQVVSLIPGVSRSGATIVGGLLTGLDRVTATAFSFYLFIPTLGAATVYSLYSAAKSGTLDTSQLPLLAVATVAAFIVSYASIAWLLRYVSSHSFRVFGIYRIIAGVIIIGLALFTPLLIG